jgi:hypothetical protein
VVDQAAAVEFGGHGCLRRLVAPDAISIAV